MDIDTIYVRVAPGSEAMRPITDDELYDSLLDALDSEEEARNFLERVASRLAELAYHQGLNAGRRGA